MKEIRLRHDDVLMTKSMREIYDLMWQLKTVLEEVEDDPSLEGDISVEVAGARVPLSLTQAFNLFCECFKIVHQFAVDMHKRTINANNN